MEELKIGIRKVKNGFVVSEFCEEANTEVAKDENELKSCVLNVFIRGVEEKRKKIKKEKLAKEEAKKVATKNA